MADSADQQMRSLAKLAEAKILKDLNISLWTQARSATFACGGSIFFKDTTEGNTECDAEKNAETNAEGSPEKKDGENHREDDEDDDKDNNTGNAENNAIDDIQVRFGRSGSGYSVNFGQDGPSGDFEHLLQACQPASFGRGGEAVLDDKYRKAGKLDRSEFATNFCPYESGIVDVVTQLLAPQYEDDKHVRGIKVIFYDGSFPTLSVLRSPQYVRLSSTNSTYTVHPMGNSSLT